MYNFYNDINLFPFKEPRQNIKNMKFVQKLKFIKKLYLKYTFINYAKTSKFTRSLIKLAATRLFLFFFTSHKLASINVYTFFIYFFYKLKKFKIQSFSNLLLFNNFFLHQQNAAYSFVTRNCVKSAVYLNTKLSINDYFFNNTAVKK